MISSRRLFSSSGINCTPRKFKLPTKYNAVSFPNGWEHTPRFKRILSPQTPTVQQLSTPYLTMKAYMDSLQKKTHLSDHQSTETDQVTPFEPSIRYAPRYPLPTTFEKGQDHKTWLADMKKDEEPLTSDPNFYPYKYYEITMIRGTIGLPVKTKRITKSLGLSVVNQVVYKPVSEAIAGKILKVKELVRLRLVNEIPAPQQTVLGYKKIGNAIGKSVLNM